MEARHVIRRTFLSLALLLLLGQSARPEDDPEPSVPLRGKWQQIVRVENGQPSDKDLIRRRTITFEKDRYKLRDGEQVIAELTIVIDRSKKPAHLDATFVDSKAAIKGILKMEKGVLTFCMAEQGGNRPDKFESKPGDGRILASYRRVK
jgi:uncharacterized protein (TIGR03067 family)